VGGMICGKKRKIDAGERTTGKLENATGAEDL